MTALNPVTAYCDPITPDRDQVQLLLAIANAELLRSLLTQSTPVIAHSHQIGQIRISIGAPPEQPEIDILDAVLEYEHLGCALAEGAPPIDVQSLRDYRYLTRCQSALKTLAWRVNLSDAIALLSHGGFQEAQIQRILQLPWDGWHRSWWDTFDPEGRLGLPFQRWFRTRCYGDGTYTLQYRDFYAQDAPPCFRGVWRQVPLRAAQPEEGFGSTLASLKRARYCLDTDRSLLLTHQATSLEVEGYIRQGISLYPLHDLWCSEQTLCQRCDRHVCPINREHNIPVTQCRNYLPPSTTAN